MKHCRPKKNKVVGAGTKEEDDENMLPS